MCWISDLNPICQGQVGTLGRIHRNAFWKPRDCVGGVGEIVHSKEEEELVLKEAR